MNTNTTNHKKSALAGVGAAVAAVAVPAFLFAGAGTAQAYWGINVSPEPGGVWVHINSVCMPILSPGGPVDSPESHAQCDANISSGKCTYTATPPIGLPTTRVFKLEPAGKADLWFDGIPTGTTWTVTVDCDHGTDTGSQQVVY
jgi:hypothetical protein